MISILAELVGLVPFGWTLRVSSDRAGLSYQRLENETNETVE